VSFLSVRGVAKRFGSVAALDHLSFDVAEGECLALLGPSGCGKTTLLNIVAGFLDADAGDITMGGKSLIGVPAHRRDMGMVFQDYALFPHLSVRDNVAFGLRMRGIAPDKRQAEAEQALALVGLAGYGDRGVHQLSGGQRQRVAVARALAIRPRLLLFDEPLSNLDARLRDTMRVEIRSLLTRTRITALFVTHDQAEAFAVADRVALLNAGKLEQIGPPSELYEHPASQFAAGFLGTCNLIPGTVAGRDGGVLRIDALGTRLGATWPADKPPPAAGARVTVAVRPHHIAPDDGAAENRVPTTVESVEYLGWLSRITLRHGSGASLVLDWPGRTPLSVGATVVAGWRTADSWALAEATA
jgi:putative spermidine/putrescine transport system ATP-binding protein